MSLTRLASTLKRASVQKVKQDAVGQFLHVFIREARSSEFGEMVAFSHVPGCGIIGARGENNVSLFVNAHDSAFPEQSLWELDVHLANIDGL